MIYMRFSDIKPLFSDPLSNDTLQKTETKRSLKEYEAKETM